MRFLRQNTAVIVTVGPFYDKTDGVTIETALTITNERITLTADTDDGSAPTNILDNVTGATSATANDLNYITGNDAGMMQMELSAANTNRVGRMLLSITDAANHCPVFHEFFILPQAIYDWLTGVIVPLPANVTQVSGTAQTARDLGASVLLSSGTGTGQLSLSSGAVLLQATQTGVTIPTVTNLTNAPTAGDLTATMKTSVTTAATAATPTAAAVTGAVGSIGTGGIAAASFAAGAINAAAIAADAIGASELAADAATEIGAAALAAGDIDGYTLEQALKIVLAALAGKLSGAATTTVTIRSADDTADRITATVDASGNRSALTLNAVG